VAFEVPHPMTLPSANVCVERDNLDHLYPHISHPVVSGAIEMNGYRLVAVPPSNRGFVVIESCSERIHGLPHILGFTLRTRHNIDAIARIAIRRGGNGEGVGGGGAFNRCGEDAMWGTITLGGTYLASFVSTSVKAGRECMEWAGR
jgi:hypothetical protein